jgi:hypothetical protein
MYRSFGQMYEGWTKNLALLFGNAILALAAWRVIDLLLLIGLAGALLRTLSAEVMLWWVLMALWARTLWRFYRRVARSNFPFWDCAACRSSDCRCFHGCWREAGFITR